MGGMKLFMKAEHPRTKRVLVIAKMNDISFDFVGGDAGDDGSYFGKIPVLDTGKGVAGNEFCIFSTNAISRYLARVRPDVGLYGQNFLESGEVDSWVDFSTNELEIPMCAWVYPLEGIFPEVPAATAEAKKDVEQALSTFDKHLLLRTFMVGHQVTMADIHVASVLYPAVVKHNVLAPMMKKFANVQRWWNTVSQFPAFAEVFTMPKPAAGGAAPAAGAAKGGDKAAKGGDKGAKGGDKKEQKGGDSKGKGKEQPQGGKKSSGKQDAAPAAAKGNGKEPTAQDLKDLEEQKETVIGLKKMKAEKSTIDAAVKELLRLKELCGDAGAPKGGDKGGKKSAGPPPPPVEKKPETKEEKKLKKVIKEGGKRGVEIEGAASMGGLQYFSTKMDEPFGNLDLLITSVDAMNAPSDPAEEERKGGAGEIGKVVISSNSDTNDMSIVAYVPKSKGKDLSAKAWLEEIMKSCNMPPSKVPLDARSNDVMAMIYIKTDPDKDVFPLKFRDDVISKGNDILRKKNLIPVIDDDDDDEMIFGDEDMNFD